MRHTRCISATRRVFGRFVQIWLYLFPILWATEHIVGRFSGPIMTLIQLNPTYSIVGGYTELLQNDAFPPTHIWISVRVGGWLR